MATKGDQTLPVDDKEKTAQPRASAPVRSLKSRARNKQKQQALYRRHQQTRSPQNAQGASRVAPFSENDSTPTSPDSDEDHLTEKKEESVAPDIPKQPPPSSDSKVGQAESKKSNAGTSQEAVSDASLLSSPQRPRPGSRIMPSPRTTPTRPGIGIARSASGGSPAQQTGATSKIDKPSPSRRKNDLINRIANRKAIARGTSPGRISTSKSESDVDTSAMAATNTPTPPTSIVRSATSPPPTSAAPPPQPMRTAGTSYSHSNTINALPNLDAKPIPKPQMSASPSLMNSPGRKFAARRVHRALRGRSIERSDLKLPPSETNQESNTSTLGSKSRSTAGVPQQQGTIENLGTSDSGSEVEIQSEKPEDSEVQQGVVVSDSTEAQGVEILPQKENQNLEQEAKVGDQTEAKEEKMDSEPEKENVEQEVKLGNQTEAKVEKMDSEPEKENVEQEVKLGNQTEAKEEKMDSEPVGDEHKEVEPTQSLDEMKEEEELLVLQDENVQMEVEPKQGNEHVNVQASAGTSEMETEVSDDDEPLDENLEMVNNVHIYPKPETDLAMKDLSTETKENLEQYKDEDPQLEDVKSDVSAGTFDMRSILVYPPSPPPPVKEEPADPTWDTSKTLFTEQGGEPSKDTLDALDIFETDSWAVTNTDFSAMNTAHPDIEAVASRLMLEQRMENETTIEEETTQHPMPIETKSDEEKKEKESADEDDNSACVDPSVQLVDDPTWDTSNPLFEQPLQPSKSDGDDAPNMFDTASWGNADAAFSDVSLSKTVKHLDIEAEYSRIMKEGTETSNPTIPEEQPSDLGGMKENCDNLMSSNSPSETDTNNEAAHAESLPAVAAVNAPGHVECESKDQEDDTASATHPHETPKENVIDDHKQGLNDDVPLLPSASSASDVDVDGQGVDTTDKLVIEQPMPLPERVQMYTAALVDDSSVDLDEDVKGDESEGEGSVGEVLNYIEQASDNEEEDDNDRELPMPELPEDSIANHDVPTFDIAAAAAQSAMQPLPVVSEASTSNDQLETPSGRPTIQLENLDIIDDGSESQADTKAAEASVMENSMVSSLLGEQFLGGASVGGSSAATGGSALSKRVVPVSGIPPRGIILPAGALLPPPPPPPAEKKKKRRGSSRSEEKADIPLIPPPPSEKLKKWEESKTRAFDHIHALKENQDRKNFDSTSSGVVAKASETHLSGASSPVDAARAFVIQNALERVGKNESTNDVQRSGSSGTEESKDFDETEQNSVEGPPSVMRKAFSDGFGPPRPNDMWKDQGIFVPEGKSKLPKASGDKSRSPKGGSSILIDQKMAEKVAIASSAAAVTFEERFVQCPQTSPSLESIEEPTSTIDAQPEAPMVFCAGPENMQEMQESFLKVAQQVAKDGEAQIDPSFLYGVASPLSRPEPSDKLHDTGLELVGGAFSPWKNPGLKVNRSFQLGSLSEGTEQTDSESRLIWFCKEVLAVDFVLSKSHKDISLVARLLLEDDVNFNSLCQFLSNCVNKITMALSNLGDFDDLSATVTSGDDSTKTAESTLGNLSEKAASLLKKRPILKPMVLTDESRALPPAVLAANFVAFLHQVATLAQVPNPFGDKNPFLLALVDKSLRPSDPEGHGSYQSTVQQLIFDHPQGAADSIIDFAFDVSYVCESQLAAISEEKIKEIPDVANVRSSNEPSQATNESWTLGKDKRKDHSRRAIVPDDHPSPFESSVLEVPRIVVAALSFLGDPVAVCRMKMVNKFCKQIISENEQMIMRDAVRAGGLSMNVRPAFWMWITLQKCGREKDSTEWHRGLPKSGSSDDNGNTILLQMEKRGREGKWHSVIQRDVSRAFGNMPPHKTGARLRTDSIVRALVTWGRNRIMKRGVKGGGDAVPIPNIGPREGRRQKGKPRQSMSPPPWETTNETTNDESEKSELGQTPTDTVSDWGGVSPVGSFAGSTSGLTDGDAEMRLSMNRSSNGLCTVPDEDLALSGNALTEDMKVDLQNKLGFILHSLADAHEDVGYCQGMDYVVAHLLRILQDTVRWKAARGTLPETIKATSTLPKLNELRSMTPQIVHKEIDRSRVVEETVFRVMDTFFTTYNLRHMYWPELRCLKICCRIFERLIQIKLPVLADHFEHHDLNVGLFALGWFQTLFLYLPSMPSATVCHMWDIWLVERSFKIFFRVGTAILFLSQPILLNHELEGMMTYLNTIPDATLLNPDILIACALNIKVTNRMLSELESEVTQSH